MSFSFEKNISYFLQPIKRLQGLASRQQQWKLISERAKRNYNLSIIKLKKYSSRLYFLDNNKETMLIILNV